MFYKKRIIELEKKIWQLSNPPQIKIGEKIDDIIIGRPGVLVLRGKYLTNYKTLNLSNGNVADYLEITLLDIKEHFKIKNKLKTK